MTATVSEEYKAPPAGGVGRIARITGPVVDVEFPVDAMPEQYNLLKTEVELSGDAPMPIQFEPVADQPGAMEASFTPEQAGGYTLRVVIASSTATADADGALRPSSATWRAPCAMSQPAT